MRATYFALQTSPGADQTRNGFSNEFWALTSRSKRYIHVMCARASTCPHLDALSWPDPPSGYWLGFGSRFPSWSPGCLRATRVTSSGRLDEDLHLDDDLHLAGDLGILDY